MSFLLFSIYVVLWSRTFGRSELESSKKPGGFVTQDVSGGSVWRCGTVLHHVWMFG